jgi:hypothetical protein
MQGSGRHGMQEHFAKVHCAYMKCVAVRQDWCCESRDHEQWGVESLA